MARTWHGKFPYFVPDLPTIEVETAWGTFQNVIDSKTSEKVIPMQQHPVTVVDARTHTPEGLDSWDFETHGFCYLNRPAFDFPDHTAQDRKQVTAVFAPEVLEAVRKKCKAKKAYWMSHQRRGEDKVRTSGPGAEGYVLDFAHSDYGPDFERQFRTVLCRRYGMSMKDAQTCDFCVVNMWSPVQWSAFRNPLCYLDASTIGSMATGTIKYILPKDTDTGYSYDKIRNHSRPLEERVPIAAKDAPALAPLYSSNHRWVYCSDMTKDEAVIFKQFDFRKSGVDTSTRTTFHRAFADPFHQNWKDCPPRRSIECRIILVFDDHDKNKNEVDKEKEVLTRTTTTCKL
jgi:hypothetical protein